MKQTIVLDFPDHDTKREFLDRFSTVLTNLTKIPISQATIGVSEVRIELSEGAGWRGVSARRVQTVSADAFASVYYPPIVVKCSGLCGKTLTVPQLIADAERYILHAHHEYDEADFRRHFDWATHSRSLYLQAVLEGHNEWMPWCGRKDCGI